jgi:hypothetical protein
MITVEKNVALSILSWLGRCPLEGPLGTVMWTAARDPWLGLLIVIVTPFPQRKVEVFPLSWMVHTGDSQLARTADSCTQFRFLHVIVDALLLASVFLKVTGRACEECGSLASTLVTLFSGFFFFLWYWVLNLVYTWATPSALFCAGFLVR